MSGKQKSQKLTDPDMLEEYWFAQFDQKNVVVMFFYRCYHHQFLHGMNRSENSDILSFQTACMAKNIFIEP